MTTCTMTHEVTQFSFEDRPVRTLTDELGEVWFVAKDVCDILDLTNPTESLKALDDDELTSEKLRSGGQAREMNFISESGLYTLIIRSNKPQAKPFRRWVTHDVLPSIRKTGSYAIPGAVHSVPPGMTLVPAEEIFELYRDTKTLLLENNKLLQKQLQAAEARIPNRINFTPDEDAQVIKLHKQGLSQREIGLAIGRKKGSVGSCLYRLRKKGIYAGREN